MSFKEFAPQLLAALGAALATIAVFLAFYSPDTPAEVAHDHPFCRYCLAAIFGALAWYLLKEEPGDALPNPKRPKRQKKERE